MRTGRAVPWRSPIAHLEATNGYRRQLATRLTDDPFAFLSHTDFLMKDLGRAERLAHLLDHYTIEETCFPDAAFVDLYEPCGILLWSLDDDGERFEIRLEQAERNLFEGFLSVGLWVDDRCVRVASFTFVDGARLGTTEAHSLLVTRHQRMPGIDDSTGAHLFRQHSPQYIVMAALAGVAVGIGATSFGQVTPRSQVLFDEAYASSFEHSYATAWKSFSPTSIDGRTVRFDAPLQTGDVSKVGSKHRARARRRRALWSEITEATATRIAECQHGPIEPSARHRSAS